MSTTKTLLARRRALGLMAGSTLCAALLAAGTATTHAFSRAGSSLVDAPALDLSPGNETSATAIFAGGCFWGVQGVFQHVQGVERVLSGYAGGSAVNANYDAVSSGRTDHAEAVEITYDPRQVSYGTLLRIFFSVAHDPTEINRQGPDVGRQYRSAIFPLDAGQERVARAYIEQLDAARVFPRRVATQLEAGQGFHVAEDYHQDFLTRHPRHPYIVMHDLPKIEQLKRLFPELYREQAVLVGAS